MDTGHLTGMKIRNSEVTIQAEILRVLRKNAGNQACNSQWRKCLYIMLDFSGIWKRTRH